MTEHERWQPAPVPQGDGWHDIGDDARAAIVRRLMQDWSRDPDLTPEKVRQLAIWAGASVRALLHELGTLRDLAGESSYIPERDGRRCAEHPKADHELVCLTCLESKSDASPSVATNTVAIAEILSDGKGKGVNGALDPSICLPQEGWQPIETGPKTVTREILLGFASPPMATVEGFWAPALGYWVSSLNPTKPFYPTHWMPLPSPPSVKDERTDAFGLPGSAATKGE